LTLAIVKLSCPFARMAKLADAADLKSAGRKAVGVQIPLWAPNKINKLQQKCHSDLEWHFLPSGSFGGSF